MNSTTIDSPGYLNISESDPVESLLREICIVYLSDNVSYCARLVEIRDGELWFESKTGQKWMVKRQALAGIRPMHHAPGKRY